MERILVLVDGDGIQRETMEFACYIANLTQSKLTGLFYNPDGEAQWHSPVAGHGAKDVLGDIVTHQHHLAEMKAAFVRFCDNQQLLRKPESIDVIRLEEIYLQTRFADLIILTPDYGANPNQSTLASQNVLNVLKHAECPVFVAPLTMKELSEIVFTYDGTSSSVFAIKQFTQLFPQLKDLSVTLLEVKSDYSDSIDFHESINGYLASHFRYVKEMVLKGKPEDELFSYLLDKKQIFVVLGAFGKHFMYSLLHRSTATLLLQTTALPVFISHK